MLELVEPGDGQPIGHVRAPAPAPCAFAVRVFGDELYPAVRHGACLVVDGAGEPVVGELVLVRLHDGGHLVCEYVSGGTDHLTVMPAAGGARRTLARARVAAVHPVTHVVSASQFKPAG